MTQEEIIKSNKLIAEFMGYTQGNHSYGMEINGKYYTYSLMLYDSSWDWLMPVIQKIATLGFKVTLEFEEKPYLNSISIQDNSTGEYIEEDYEDIDYEIESDIHLVWFNVVNFIKWKLR